MDQIVVEIPSGRRADVGDVVLVLGGDPASARHHSRRWPISWAPTPYEVIVGFRERIPRRLFRAGKLVARSQR